MCNKYLSSKRQSELGGVIELLPAMDEFGFNHWYLFTFGPYVFLVSLGIMYQFLTNQVIALSINYARMSDWIFIFAAGTLSINAIIFNYYRRILCETLFRFGESKRTKPRTDFVDNSIAYENFIKRYQRLLLSKKRYLLIGALIGMTLALCLLPVLKFLPRIISFGPLPILGVLLANVLAPVIWTYFTGSGAWLLTVTGLFISQLTDLFDIKIQPSHPDGCGGLRPIGSLCLLMATPVLIGTVFLSIFGLGGILNRTAPITFAANIGLIFFAIPLAITAFLFPLWNVHLEMKRQKQAYEEEYACRISLLQEKIRDAIDQGNVDVARTTLEEVEILKTLHPNEIRYPEWPFDRQIFLKFLTPQIVSSVSLIAGISEPVAESVRVLLASFTGSTP